MGLKVTSRIPAGNVCAVEVLEKGEEPELRFSPNPHHCRQGLWFHFRIEASEARPDTRVKLVLKHFDTLYGAGETGAIIPVYHREGQGWLRMKHGREEKGPDGQRHASWYIRYPEPSVDVALCYPYGPGEVRNLVSKSKGYWASDEIGVSGGGRGIVRLSNMYQAMGEGQRGLYLVARHHPGETPGSWLLDGFLRHLSMTGKKSLMTWAVPLCDADGVQRGRFRAHHAFAVSPERSALGDDVRRWRERCQPLLAISFEAAGAGDTQGLYCTAEGEAAAKWSNIFKDALRTGFAAPEFCRSAEPEPGVGAGVFHELGITAVTLHAPYALVGTSELVQKDYRQIGKRLAEAVLRRNGK